MAGSEFKFTGGRFGPVRFSRDDIDMQTPGHIATRCTIEFDTPTPFFVGRTDFAYVKRCNVTDGGKASEKLRSEIGLLKTLNHDNIISFIGHYEGLVSDQKVLLVATEFSDKTVYDFLRSDQDLNPGVLKSWSVQAAMALHYLQASHNEVILHQDICSHNFLIVGNPPSQVLKLSGFHSSKVYTGVTSSDRTDNTEIHQEWKAPEVLTEGKVSKRSDIYSLIVFIWELHTRLIPFEQYNHDAYQIMQAVARRKERPDIPRDCREDLRDLLTRGWSGNEEDRPDTSFILATLSNM